MAMNRKGNPRISLVLALALLLGFAVLGTAYAQGGGGYDLSWWTVDSAGERVEGGGLTLVGTAGQPDAGPVLGGIAADGSTYSLVGGYWPAGSTVRYHVYLPLAVRTR